MPLALVVWSEWYSLVKIFFLIPWPASCFHEKVVNLKIEIHFALSGFVVSGVAQEQRNRASIRTLR